MSVYIKGMGKPSDCIFCPLFNGAWSNCSLLDRTVNPKGTPADCPLIELPPHGRLIDMDALPQGRVEWEDVLNAPTIIEAEEKTE